MTDLAPPRATPEPTWEPPGPGSWICDRSHSRPGPTPLFRRLISENTAPVYREIFERFGGAVDTFDMQFVDGTLYRRLVPLVGAKHDRGKLPPRPILWLASRLHPAFRRRERTAQATLEHQTFLADIDHWIDTERFEWIERNRVLQAVEPNGLSDRALADHIDTIEARLLEGWRRHHELHANDLGPIGDLLVYARSAGMDLVQVMDLLRGESPATLESARAGARIAQALRDGGVDPTTVTSIDQIRSVPAADSALDDYLDVFGWRLVSDYDIEGATLGEMPTAICSIVRRSAARDDARHRDDPAAVQDLRAQSGDPVEFDDRLASARRAYGVRDDNGPLTWAWPAGLMRRAYLAAAARLSATGRIALADHVFELDSAELAGALRGGAEPTAEALAERAEVRRWEATLRGPDLLGPPPAEPDVSALPPALRRLMGITLAAVEMLEPDLDREVVPLTGLGIGDTVYTGTARVATDPAAVVDEMEPGDVLVAAWTAPSYNAIFAIAGAVVVQEGGLLAHAAVLARELGLPAVIGCSEAMSRISSGDLVEVDPTSGVVRIL